MLLPASTWQSVFYGRINQLLIMRFDDAGYVLGAADIFPCLVIEHSRYMTYYLLVYSSLLIN